MGKRTYEDVAEYVERQSQYKCKVISAKPEQHFNDLGVDVTVWNVKTDTDGTWWVVEGDTVPMNLYPQGAYYFGTDEAYSFHTGIMQRMQSSRAQYNPDDYIEAATLGTEIAPQLLRKLMITITAYYTNRILCVHLRDIIDVALSSFTLQIEPPQKAFAIY